MTSPVRTAQTESEPLVARPPTLQRELLVEQASTSLWTRWLCRWGWCRQEGWRGPHLEGCQALSEGGEEGVRRDQHDGGERLVPEEASFEAKLSKLRRIGGDPRERRMNEVLSWPLSSDWITSTIITVLIVLTITLRSRQDREMLNTVSGGARGIREAFNKCLSWGFIQDWDGVSTTGIHWAKVKSLDWRFSKIFWLSFQRDTVEVSFLCQIVKMIKTKYLDCWRPDSLRFLCPDNDYQLERVKNVNLNNDQTMTNWREWKL